jgi:hypothetical protein
LFFGGADMEQMHLSGCGQAWGLGSRYNRRRAAEKQKEEKGWHRLLL